MSIRTAAHAGMLACVVMCVVALPACTSTRPEGVAGPWPPAGQWMPPVASSSTSQDQQPQASTYAPPHAHPGPPPASAPSAEPDPRCPKDVFAGGADVNVVRDAVAACVNWQFIDDRAAVATLARAIGTRTGDSVTARCRGGLPTIAMIDAQGKSVVLLFCADAGVREARVAGLRTILTADPAGIEAWLRERGIDVAKVR